MTCFFAALAMLGGGFCAGYFVSSHPTDARAFGQRVRDTIGRFIHRNDPPTK